MALADEVTSRYSAQILINASNPQDSAATAISTARLGFAVTDVQAAFSKRGIAYDNTIATHVATAVPGVFARLLVMTGQQGGLDLWREFLDDVELLAETTSRNRVLPTTNSLLTPTAEQAGAKPVSDSANWKNFTPNAPGTTQAQD